MLKNYITIAIRTIRRYASHSILNIAGLAIALAACIVIFLVLDHEYSYDRYHPNADRVVQLVKEQSKDGIKGYYVGVPFPARKALANDFPELRVTELFTSFGSQISIVEKEEEPAKKFIEDKGVFFVEPNIVDFFALRWLSGTADALANPNVVAISESKAIKYFGSAEKAMGKRILFDNILSLQVEGVFVDPPANTDFNFQVLPSYKTFTSNVNAWGYGDAIDGWGLSTSNHQVYALLPEGKKAEDYTGQLQQFAEKYYSQQSGGKIVHFFRPLSEIHFDARMGNNGTHVSSKASLRTLMFIGVLILLMACINFINLTTALAARRSKEIGLRKVMGGTVRQLRLQILTETTLIVCLSMVFAIVICWFVIPYLKYITDIQQRLELFTPDSIQFMVVVIVVTSLLSGYYPSFVLSRYNPINALKNKINNSSIAGLSLRRVLVVLQFSFSQFLVIATIIAVTQMNFIRTADLGFDKEAVIILTGNNDSVTVARQPAFRAALKQLPEVQQVSFSFDAPSSQNNWTTNFSFDNRSEDQPFDTDIKMADGAYGETFGLKMLAGSFYNEADSVPKVVVNETMVRKLGLRDPQEAIGKTIRLGTMPWTPIVGVVQDFKNNSLRESIPPTVIGMAPKSSRNYMSQSNIKLVSGNPAETMAKIEKIWNQYYPEYTFRGEFLDESIANFYQQEQRLSLLYRVFAALAIVISCLGLYGLISFMTVQKNKEVGIRKVLGASVANIVVLFSREFTILLLIAFFLAAPIAWYVMNNWLQNFVFKVSIGWWVFAIAVLTSLVIAWLTVGYKAVSAAMANPVKSLKTE